MYWYKVKNILIVLFALINIFLVIIILNSNTSSKREEEQLSQALVSVLSTNNVQIAQDVLSKKNPLMSSYGIENDVEDTTEFAEKIIGKGAQPSVDEGGTPFYKNNTCVLYTENGRFAMSDSSLSPIVQTDADAAAARDFFMSAGFDMSHARYSLQKDKIEFTFYIDERPLFVNTLYASVANGKIARCGGCIIRINGQLGKPRATRAQTLALTEFLRDEKRPHTPLNIIDISAGYSILLGDTSVNFKYAEAVPTYRIITDDNYAYYYSANAG